MGILRSIFAGDREMPGPADDFWYQAIGHVAKTGERISPERAMQTSVVFACVRILAETLASVPLQLYERDQNGDRKLATGDPLYRVLHTDPNPWQTSYEWRELLMGHLALRGRAFSQIQWFDDGRAHLIPLNPLRVQVGRSESGMLTYLYKPSQGKPFAIPQENMLHINGFMLQSDDLVGVDPVTQHMESIGLTVAAESYGAKYYKNDARPRGVLKMPGHFKDAAAIARFRSEWEQAQGGENLGRTAVLEGGLEYQAIGASPDASQFLATRRYQVEEIARIYRIPLSLLQDDSRSTFSNIEQKGIDFVTHTLRPWAVKIEQRLGKALLADRPNHFFELNLDGLVRGDIVTRYQSYQSGIQSGWLTRNEARRRENLAPIPGLDEPLALLNMGSGQTPGEQAGRNKRLIENAAESVVKKEVSAVRVSAGKLRGADFAAWARGFYRAHAAFVGDRMALSEALSVQYCEMSLRDLRETEDLEAMLAAWPGVLMGRLVELAR